MAEHRRTSGTNQPEDRGDGRGPDTQGNRNDEQTSVELRGVQTSDTQFQITTFQFPNTVETTGDEDDDEEEQEVGQQAVDAEHDEDDSIVAGEVGQVVVNTALDLTEVSRLGETLHVEEFGDRAEVGEARTDGLGADAVKAIAELRGDGADRELHGEYVAVVYVER